MILEVELLSPVEHWDQVFPIGEETLQSDPQTENHITIAVLTNIHNRATHGRHIVCMGGNILD